MVQKIDAIFRHEISRPLHSNTLFKKIVQKVKGILNSTDYGEKENYKYRNLLIFGFHFIKQTRGLSGNINDPTQ